MVISAFGAVHCVICAIGGFVAAATVRWMVATVGPLVGMIGVVVR